MTNRAIENAERLSIAGTVAPTLRRADEAVRQRKIHRINADGEVVGFMTLGELQAGVLAARKIEFDVVEGAKPKKVLCHRCGLSFDRPKKGVTPKTCKKCMVVHCACGVLLSAEARRLLTKVCRSCHYASSAVTAALAKGRKSPARIAYLAAMVTQAALLRAACFPSFSLVSTAKRNQTVWLCKCGTTIERRNHRAKESGITCKACGAHDPAPSKTVRNAR